MFLTCTDRQNRFTSIVYNTIAKIETKIIAQTAHAINFNGLQIITYFNFIKVSSDDLENKMAIAVAAGVST